MIDLNRKKLTLYGEQEYSVMKEIIKTRWVWNEQTQEHEEVEYHTGKYKLDESDKIAIVSEYMQGQMSASQIIEKYGISTFDNHFRGMGPPM